MNDLTQARMPTPGRSPTVVERVFNSVAERWRQLQPAPGRYTVARKVQVPMRDGVVLLADVYTPADSVRGTLLVRSPYGWQLPAATLAGGLYASRGYRVVLAYCRGTFGSGGTFEPMMREVEDGLDTVAWMRKQPWFEGRFATFGASYVGFTQWALLMDPPPELAAAVIAMAPNDMYTAAYQGGAFTLDDFLSWADQVAHQEDPLLQRLKNMTSGRRRLTQALQHLPMVEASKRLLAERAPWFREWVSRRDANDPMWQAMNLEKSLDRVKVPVLLQGGWQDLFLSQTLAQYVHLAGRGVDVALTVGPWKHVEMITTGGALTVRETLDWFEEHLAGTGARMRPQPVKIFVTGTGGQWRDFSAWPPPTDDYSLYFQAGDGLGEQPSLTDSEATFTYDPADPTPTIGGRTLMGGGYTDDSALIARDDVLAFTGPTLKAPLEVIGGPVVEINHFSDNPHADLFLRLCEVGPDGRSQNVSDGFLRIDSLANKNNLRLELDAVAHRFAAGNRICLLVAGGCYPRWERNLGTGDDPATSVRMMPSRRIIDLRSSRLRLPINRAT
jgi:uncharacterized protein